MPGGATGGAAPGAPSGTSNLETRFRSGSDGGGGGAVSGARGGGGGASRRRSFSGSAEPLLLRRRPRSLFLSSAERLLLRRRPRCRRRPPPSLSLSRSRSRSRRFFLLLALRLSPLLSLSLSSCRLRSALRRSRRLSFSSSSSSLASSSLFFRFGLFFRSSRCESRSSSSLPMATRVVVRMRELMRDAVPRFSRRATNIAATAEQRLHSREQKPRTQSQLLPALVRQRRRPACWPGDDFSMADDSSLLAPERPSSSSSVEEGPGKRQRVAPVTRQPHLGTLRVDMPQLCRAYVLGTAPPRVPHVPGTRPGPRAQHGTHARLGLWHHRCLNGGRHRLPRG